MAAYLHTMYRITDPAGSRAFYEALGMEFRRDMAIVRDGEVEATNYFLGLPARLPSLSSRSITTGAATSWARVMGTLRLASRISTRRSRVSRSRASSRSARPIVSGRAATGSASCGTRTGPASK